MGQQKILYLGDKKRLFLKDLSFHCRLNGYSFVVIDEEDYSGAIQALEGEYKILLADFPLISQELKSRIISKKQNNTFPLIFLLDNMDEAVQTKAFSLGADDVFFSELLTDGHILLLRRIESLIHVYDKEDKKKKKTWMIGNDRFSLYPSERLIELNDNPVDLTLTEWNIMFLLCEKNGSVVSREAILDQCFGQYDGYDRSIDTHIKNLRKKIPGAIGTKRGMGYRFLGV